MSPIRLGTHADYPVDPETGWGLAGLAGLARSRAVVDEAARAAS